MPQKNLYQILTDLTTGAVLIPQMEPFFGSSISALGVPAFVANAMATIIGREKSSMYRLWSTDKNNCNLKSSGYSADGTSRYFFEYFNPELDPSALFVLEYDRFEKFELRGNVWDADLGRWERLNLRDVETREALSAMLLAIMQYESNSSNYATLSANFTREYAAKFPSGPANVGPLLRELFLQFRDQLDPAKSKVIETQFMVESNFLNARDGRLKSLFEREKIGYTKSDTAALHFASDTEVTLLLDNNGDKEPEHLFVLEGILKTSPNKPLKMTSNMFPLNEHREFDEEDRSRLLTIPDWYIPVPSVMKIAQAVAGSSVFPKPFRNIMMRGPAGSGKTEGAKALAAMFGSPYGVITGHAEMEFFDITSNLIPNTDSTIRSDAEMYDILLSALKDSGLKLPSFLDIATMPDAVFEQITGQNNPCASESECFAALVSKLMAYCKNEPSLFGGESSKFKIVYSDLTMGFLRGWLVELQEMNTILKPGVLVGLNNILENGQMRLPTGEIIRRHPDTVIVFTQNVGYAGTTDGNQSVYSRIELKCDLNHPSEDELVGRIRMHVPTITEDTCRTIVQTVMRIQNTCMAEIEGGSVGTREAINWAKMSVLMGGDLREAAELTLLPSVGEDLDDIAVVRNCLYQSIEERE